MKNLIKAGVMSVSIATMPLNVKADNSGSDLKNQIKTELSTTLGDKNEYIDLYISPKVVTKAVLDYFDEEVKLYKLTPEAKTKIEEVLNSYFGAHNIFNMDNDGRMEFVIDNKKEFSLMAKKVLNIVISDMPFFVRKVIIPLFLGGNDEIQKKLDNLDETMMNMKEKQYKVMILDYVVGIIRRVEDSVDGKFTIGDYYRDITRYYPNKDSRQIFEELNNSGQVDLDIKNYKYK